MSMRFRAVMFACVFAPSVMAAQSAPVAKAFRDDASSQAKKLVAAAESMPADKYAFKPTPAQMSFGEIVTHLSGGNDILCSAISGQAAPKRAKVAPTDSKDALVGRLKETFQFCESSLGSLDDSKLSEMMTVFGEKMTRAGVMTETVGDWADHYSQAAIYLRLNGVLPPTAKKP